MDDRIRELAAARRTEADIAAIVSREGHRVTASGVHRALQRLGLAKARSGRKATSSGPAAAPAPPAPVELPEGDDACEDDIPKRLRRVLGSLEAAAEAAATDRDIARIVSAQKAITATAGLLAKVTPPAPPDPNANPDMVRLGAEAVQRLHELVDLAAGAAT